MKLSVLIGVSIVLLQSPARAASHTFKASQGSIITTDKFSCEGCTVIKGIKYPNSGKGLPVVTHMVSPNPLPTDDEVQDGFSLARYALPSPDQEDAGTCLYMATTGAAEIVWNMELGRLPESEGAGDLSERFLVNSANAIDLDDWSTDSIFVFNEMGGGVLNVDYRYTKGWFRETNGGNLARARRGQTGAQYGTRYNWLNDLTEGHQAGTVELPTFDRKLLFTSDGLWDTAVMTDATIASIKRHLRTYESPVIVIYNHFAYWHATIIVGYDESVETGDCPIVREWITYMKDGGFAYRDVERAVNRDGCSKRGAFLVRDSIYENPEGPIYDYDQGETGDERPYSQKLVYQPYDWLKYLGNHAYVVYAED